MDTIVECSYCGCKFNDGKYCKKKRIKTKWSNDAREIICLTVKQDIKLSYTPTSTG